MAGIIACAPRCDSDQLYVDQGHLLASDSNPGTETQPWKTITKAAATAAAGDTVLIKAGVYYEVVVIAHSGTVASPIVFEAYPGHSVVVDGTGNGGWYGVISLHGNDYVHLHDLEIRNNNVGWGVLVEHEEDNVANGATDVELTGLEVHHTGGEAIQIRGNAAQVLIEDCVVHDAANPSGIDIYQWGGGRPHHVTVRGCEASNYPGFAGIASEQADDLLIEHNTCSNSGLGIDVGSGDRNVIRYNTVSSCDTGIALSSNEDSEVSHNRVSDIADEALYAYYWSAHGEAHARNLWYANWIEDAGFGIYESDRKGSSGSPGPTSDHSYVNNVFVNIGYHGSYRTPLYFRGTTGLSFLHNTVILNDDHDGLELCDGATGADVRNNIIQVAGSATPITVDAASSSGTVVDYNCYHNRTSTSSGPGAHAVLADPQFANPATGDYHLQPGSPCADEGQSSDVTADYDGVPRPQGDGVDIGAFELAPGLIFFDGFESGDTTAWS